MTRGAYIVGVFREPDATEKAITELLHANVSEESISVLIPKEEAIRDRFTHIVAPNTTSVLQKILGMTIGGMIGLIIGEIISALLYVMASVSGSVMMIVACALLGGLSGYWLSIMKEEGGIRWYQAELESGRFLVVVQSQRQSADVAKIFRKHKAARIDPNDLEISSE